MQSLTFFCCLIRPSFNLLDSLLQEVSDKVAAYRPCVAHVSYLARLIKGPDSAVCQIGVLQEQEKKALVTVVARGCWDLVEVVGQEEVEVQEGVMGEQLGLSK